MEGQGEADVAHLEKIIFWYRLLALAALALMWLPWYYAAPSIFLSIAIFSRWAIIAHHVSHGGFDNCTPPESRYKRARFAKGLFRRISDWPEHMLPEAWDLEHNHIHHYFLNEDTDPDLVERNTRALRSDGIPKFLKYAAVALFMCTWKWSYYAPNTFAHLEAQRQKKEMPKEQPFVTLFHMFVPGWTPPFVSTSKYFFTVLLPFAVYYFVFLPSLALPLTWVYPDACRNALINLVLADVLSNLHAFVAIVPNHAGSDLYRFKTHCMPLSGSFYIRAIVSSANYSAGNDFVDFMHGFLNYQAEHHCFPKLSMLSYQKAMPRVKILAKKHGIPYVQESVWLRLRKTVACMVGDESMRRLPEGLEERMNVQ